MTDAELWGKFFLYAADEDKQDFISEICKKNRGIDMANVVLENVSQDEMNWYHESRYWMHVSDELSAKNAAERKGRAEGLEKGRKLGIEQGMKEGLAQGLEQGIVQGKTEIAKNLLALGSMSIDQISKVTGLSEEELKALSK